MALDDLLQRRDAQIDAYLAPDPNTGIETASAMDRKHLQLLMLGDMDNAGWVPVPIVKLQYQVNSAIAKE